MWTYDGILIEKKGNSYKVFSDDDVTFRVFTLEHGELNDYFKEVFKDVEDGLYQCEVGYGNPGSMQDPVIYWVRKIAEVLDWSHIEETIGNFHQM
jgi:hypothetical protein